MYKKANTETLISLSVSHRPTYTGKYHKAKGGSRDASSIHSYNLQTSID